jgi:peptide/nickel transport system substrate-binding protein
MRHGLNRRVFLGLTGLGLARGAPAAPEKNPEKTIVFVPQAMPASLDPIATPSFATRTAALAVFETLYGIDAKLNPMPQMVERHRMDEDGKLWTFQLRPGLLFHDGTKVTARDCVASLRRWMRRDRTGHSLGARLDVIEATDDLTLTLRLSKPQKLVPLMLTKSQLSPPVIMPERFADTNVDTPVEKIIGSGPFRLANLAWRPGDDLDLIRFDQYEPRLDSSSFTGGRRTVLVDRVLWRTKDDPMRALRDGSVDWVELLPPNPADDAPGDDQSAAAGIVVRTLDETGNYALLRLNTRHGPTANQRIRQIILAGVDQVAVMETVFGSNTTRFKAPIGLFPPASEFVSTAGGDRTDAKQSPRTIKARLKAAGYNDEPIRLINPVDDMILTRLTAAVIDELTEIGLAIDEHKLDGRAFEAWRRTADTPEGGDWSAFCDTFPCADNFDAFAVSAGPPPSGGLWPGWPDDAIAARLRDAWIDAPGLTAKRAISGQLQDQIFTTAPFLPLGQWFPTTAWRTTLTGQQKGPFPVFWDVARS